MLPEGLSARRTNHKLRGGGAGRPRRIILLARRNPFTRTDARLPRHTGLSCSDRTKLAIVSSLSQAKAPISKEFDVLDFFAVDDPRTILLKEAPNHIAGQAALADKKAIQQTTDHAPVHSSPVSRGGVSVVTACKSRCQPGSRATAPWFKAADMDLPKSCLSRLNRIQATTLASICTPRLRRTPDDRGCAD